MLLAIAIRRLLFVWPFCFVGYGVEGILEQIVGLSPFCERFSVMVCSIYDMLSFVIKLCESLITACFVVSSFSFESDGIDHVTVKLLCLQSSEQVGVCIKLMSKSSYKID